ncbi:MAG: hypothetical protein HQL83_15105, partial [Magnetococcales bacterium]|nr:hypothetical protein [Magnetococcales bacterium]
MTGNIAERVGGDPKPPVDNPLHPEWGVCVQAVETKSKMRHADILTISPENANFFDGFSCPENALHLPEIMVESYPQVGSALPRQSRRLK